MNRTMKPEGCKGNLIKPNEEGMVTVLIPTYRRPELLKRAIESVLSQTYFNLKIIVSDDNSQDNTEEIVHQLMHEDNRVSFYKHDANIGMDANFNFLFSKVETEYFCLLTDDDCYLDNFLYDAMLGFGNNKDVMFSLLSFPTITKTGKRIGNQLDSWPHEGFYKKGEAVFLSISGSHPIITGIIFKKEVLGEVVFRKEYGVISDVPILVKLCAKYNFFMSRKIGGHWTQHPGSLSNSRKFGDLWIKERFFLVNKYDEWFNSGLLTRGNKDSRRIAKVILVKKIIFLARVTKKYENEGRVMVDSINHPIKYLLKAHLYLINVSLYTYIVLFFRKAYIKIALLSRRVYIAIRSNLSKW